MVDGGGLVVVDVVMVMRSRWVGVGEDEVVEGR